MCTEMDAKDETQCESSSFETRYANKLTEIVYFGVPEIDGRLRAAKAGALVTTKKYARLSYTCVNRQLRT